MEKSTASSAVKKQRKPRKPKVEKVKKDEASAKAPRKSKKEKSAPKSESPVTTTASSDSTQQQTTQSSECTVVATNGVVDTKVYAHAYLDPNWLGNEDDSGSVASGILEEDFCFECGISTLSDENWDNVILCDVCEAEYHLACAKLDKIPRSTFVCHKCVKENEAMSQLRFNVSESFPLPKLKGDRKVLYSPSRPLETAWEECKKKGLMIVSNVFTYELMKLLTHGKVENKTSSGRKVDVWQGATVEVPMRLTSTTCNNVVDREGRYDLKLSEYVVQQLNLNQYLEPIFEKLKTIMGPRPQIRTHNVVFVPVGSSNQEWHWDDSEKDKRPYRYFTILIHLNSIDSKCGGTEVWTNNTGDLIRARPGDALVFSGSLLHRGLANNGYSHRFFYYCSFACGEDLNVGVM